MANQKKWTVMVWMAGDNDLEDYGAEDIEEMKAVGSNDDINVLVQFDRMSDDKTRRYYVRKGTTMDADVVQTLNETNTGDPKVAIDFFTWGVKTYPAQHYLAVLWNHGSGIDEEDIYRSAKARGLEVHRKTRSSSKSIPRRHVRAMATRRFRRSLFSTTVDSALLSKAIAYDDTSRDFLDNLELKRVLTKVRQNAQRKIDVVGFDACLMNMVEVAYQLKGAVNLVVGSEETEPGDGWPYDAVLKSLAANPDMTPEQLGSAIVQRYVASYPHDTVTQSLLDLRQSAAVAAAVDQLAQSLIGAIQTPAEYAAVTQAINAAQAYTYKDFLDLYSLCEEFKNRCKTKAVKDAAQATMNALTGNGKFVLAEKHKGASVSRSHGATIYFPRGRDVTVVYPRLDFAKATRWHHFIKAYIC